MRYAEIQQLSELFSSISDRNNPLSASYTQLYMYLLIVHSSFGGEIM